MTVSEQRMLTIDEAKEAKLQLELMIAGMLLNFQKKTGLVVESLRVEKIEYHIGSPIRQVADYRVEIDARL